jgi:replicative DNA helicase
MKKRASGQRSDLNAAMRALVGTSDERLADLRQQLFDELGERQVMSWLGRADFEKSKLLDFLEPGDFTVPQYRVIYSAVSAMIQKEGYSPSMVNWFLVANFLSERNLIDAAGGPDNVREILSFSADETVDVISIMYELRRKAAMREATAKIVNEVTFYKNAEAPNMLDTLGIIMGAAKDYEKATSLLVRSDEIYSDKLTGDVENLKSTITIPANYLIPSPFPTIQSRCPFMREQLIIVGARPGMGKTSFVVDQCFYAASRKLPTLLVTLEMPERQLMRRHISQSVEIRLSQLAQPDLSDYDSFLEEYINGFLRPTVGYLEICDGRLKKVETVNQISRYMDVLEQRMGQIGLVVIDHMQLMKADKDHRNNRLSELTEISGGLKRLSIDRKCCVLALSQLRRPQDEDPKKIKRPVQSDLRESGSLEQDADSIIMIHRPEYYWKGSEMTPDDVKGVAEFLVEKNRDGAPGMETIRWNRNFARFEDPLRGGDSLLIPRPLSDLDAVRRDPSATRENEPPEMADIV